jgi:hypothetical protein
MSMQGSDCGSHETITLQDRLEIFAAVLRALTPGTQVAVIQEGDELCHYNISKAFALFAGRPPTTMIKVADRAKRIQPWDAEAPADDNAQQEVLCP